MESLKKYLASAWQPTVSTVVKEVHPSLALFHQEIISKFGSDALQPRYRTCSGAGSEEVELVPKMRYEMDEEEWDSICPHLKSVVLQLFYERL